MGNRGSFRLLRSFHSPELNLFVTLPSTPTYLTTAWLKHEIKSHFDLSGLLFIKEADQNHFLQKARPIARIFIHSFFAKRSRCDSHHRHCPSSGRRHLTAMADNDDSDSGLSRRPLVFVIFPFAIVFICAAVVTMLYRRRQRKKFVALHPHWTHADPATARAARRLHTNRNNAARNGGGAGRRWGPWGARSQEGLNELGEAPPPYDGKRDTGDSGDVGLRDLEAGHGPTSDQPPDYPAEPGPAVVR